MGPTASFSWGGFFYPFRGSPQAGKKLCFLLQKLDFFACYIKTFCYICISKKDKINTSIMTKAVKTTFNLGDVLLISDEGIFKSFVAVVSEISISRNGVSYKMSAGVDNDFWCIFESEYNGNFANQYRIIRKVGEADEFGMGSANVL